MDLLPSEQEASEFVERIGLERAYRIYKKLAVRFDRRYLKACQASFVPINREWVRSTPFELSLSHRLLIGITINDRSNDPDKAKERIRARIQARNARRKARILRDKI
ncbi:MULTISPECIES: hypothetical protein [Vibrio]|uniref:Uncharacterized protein n=1 Tax=Vibrio splendidus TaxID=29497 RepID=A0A2T5EJG1_VIBSP|nr:MULTISPECIES: hypothetical protein [Vibrio]EHY9845628.1 hypothetical protein [Vibrio cholerae]MCS0096505.1 hypothetical protein [Vibrio cholerae]OEE71754.1 hypothetical protein A147_12855 [Vibrio splendidus FF-6]PTP20382.1 hypothetical protein CWO36_07590 [Vibrio splendidus]